MSRRYCCTGLRHMQSPTFAKLSQANTILALWLEPRRRPEIASKSMRALPAMLAVVPAIAQTAATVHTGYSHSNRHSVCGFVFAPSRDKAQLTDRKYGNV